MKRLVALLLALIQCCLLLACGQQEPQQFQVGFSKRDITPKVSLPLDGYSGANAAQFRWSDFVEKPLYATCTAITDEKGETLLLITLDLLNATIADTLAAAVAEDTGVPADRILIHATHTHSSVAISVPDPAVIDYLSHLTESVILLSKEALADRKPVETLETGFARTECCNSVRHYLLSNGEYIAYTAAKLPAGATWYGYTSEADNLLQAVRISRRDGKDILLVNWQAHPCADVNKKTITADYPGILREELETKMDCHAVYIQGGAGNLMTGTELASEKLKHDRNYHQLGQLLAEKTTEALTQGRAVSVTDICFGKKELELQTKYGDIRNVLLRGFSIGDFALVTAPFEIFDTNAMAVKESSPYQMTFYASCCGGSNGYLPTPESFDWVQAYEARITQFPKGTAEQVQTAQIQLLVDMFATTGQTAAEKPAGYVRPVAQPESNGLQYYTGATSLEDFQPAKNGFYAFEATDQKGNRHTLLLQDLQLAQQLLTQRQAEYLFDPQGVVVGILP